MRLIYKIHCSFKKCSAFFIVFCIAIAIIFTFSNPAKADVIYQAFDECYKDIEAKVSKIRNQGYTYIQVSPPQTTPLRTSSPCQGDDQWWLQYQPINYEIGNALGTESELKHLIETAHAHNVKVLVDVVLNHLADEKYLRNLETDQPLQAKVGKPLFPLTGVFFHKKDALCDYSRNLMTHGWLGLIYENKNCQGKLKQITPETLPDLKTESQQVRDKAKKYVEKILVDLKADGLRFDAMKHIEPEYFEYILKDMPHNKFVSGSKYFYGEVLDGNANAGYIKDYINKGLNITDYPLAIKMIQAFRLGGDIRSLTNPEISGVALPGVNSVRFARTHDTAFDPNRNRDLCQFPTERLSNICFSDSSDPKNEKDTFLGIAYILSLAEGLPIIYIHDADNPTVLAGVKFHETLLHQPQYFRNGSEISSEADNPNLLFIERGSKGLTIINKSGNSFDTKKAKMPGLEVGCYKELQYNFEMCVDSDKYINKWKSSERGGIDIQARSALFFVRV